ncbi:MAG TPA: helix-hairpin-helix domain-containing protein [Polyangia bacterium]|jgi:competence protein ComEA
MRTFASALAVTVLAVALVGGAATAHAAQGGSTRRDVPKVQGVVNLNQADLDQLTQLPGVGPTKARRIIEFRAKHQFKRIEELTRVKGFGRKSFGKLKTHLAVTGATTIQRIRQAPAVTPPTPAQTPPRPSAQPRPGVIH